MSLLRSVLVGGALVGVTLATASCSSGSSAASGSSSGTYDVTVSLPNGSGQALARVQRLERANGGHATFLDTRTSHGKTIVEFPDRQDAKAFITAIRNVGRLRVVSVSPAS